MLLTEDTQKSPEIARFFNRWQKIQIYLITLKHNFARSIHFPTFTCLEYEKTYSVYQDGQTKVYQARTDYPYNAASGCAAFHPSDPDVIFHFGGTNNYKAFKINLADHEYTDIADIAGNTKKIACTALGFMDKNDKPVSTK